MIEIIAVTYDHGERLKCFINSIKCQSDSRWRLNLIHDGKEDKFYHLKEELEKEGYLSDQVILSATEENHNDYGHSLRDYGLKNPVCDSDYVVITNADNYYAPVWIKTLHNRIEAFPQEQKPDIIVWDLISHHSHMNWNFDRDEPYGLLNTRIEHCAVDMGSVAVKTQLAHQVGFNSRQYDADWHYIDECYRTLESPRVEKIPQILLVHN